MVGLGDLPGGVFGSSANATSPDGSIVAGFGNTAAGLEAYIWDAVNGMRSLQGALTNDLGLDLTGWQLQHVTDISDDGMTFVGIGINPDGFTEAWMATLPPPADIPTLSEWGLVAMALLMVGAATVVLRRTQVNTKR